MTDRTEPSPIWFRWECVMAHGNKVEVIKWYHQLLTFFRWSRYFFWHLPSSFSDSLLKPNPLGSLPTKWWVCSLPRSCTAMAYSRGLTHDCRQKGTFVSPTECLQHIGRHGKKHRNQSKHQNKGVLAGQCTCWRLWEWKNTRQLEGQNSNLLLGHRLKVFCCMIFFSSN